MTALELLNDIFEAIKVKTTGIALTTDHISKGLRFANRFMESSAAEEMSLGWTTLNASTDTVTLPAWAEEYVICEVAAMLAPDYGKNLSLEFHQRRTKANDAVNHMHVQTYGRQYYPSTMPLGAGSEGFGGTNINNLNGSSGAFFGPQDENDLLDGHGGALTDSEGRILEE